jgi:hypothetical protein
MTFNQIQQVPRSGMFATVRNRRGVIVGVEPFDGDSGRLHLVHLEYGNAKPQRSFSFSEAPFSAADGTSC